MSLGITVGIKQKKFTMFIITFKVNRIRVKTPGPIFMYKKHPWKNYSIAFKLPQQLTAASEIKLFFLQSKPYFSFLGLHCFAFYECTIFRVKAVCVKL